MAYSSSTSTSVVWYEWNATPTTTTSVWAYWTDGGTSTRSASTTVWCRWAGTGSGAVPACYQPPALTKAEQAKQDEANRKRAEAEKIRLAQERKALEEADRRAEELLVAHLDKEQRKQYRTEKKFKVVGGDGALFEIGSAWSSNVREMTPDGKHIARFCIHPRESVPIPDLLLAQKLMLETDPAEFRKIANRTALAGV